MLRYLIMYLYKKKNGKKFDLKIARDRGLPYSGWTYQSETTLLSCLNSPLRISLSTPVVSAARANQSKRTFCLSNLKTAEIDAQTQNVQLASRRKAKNLSKVF